MKRNYFKYVFIVLVLSVLIMFNQFFLRLIFGIGYSQVYKGNDNLGNSLMEYSSTLIVDKDASFLRQFSIQNTKNGNYAIAIDKLKKAYEINPDEVGPYFGWVLLYYYHDFQRAYDVLNEVDNRTPNFSDAPMGEDIDYLKGLCLMQMNEPEKAIAEFTKYLDNMILLGHKDYVNAYTYVHIGRCFTSLGNDLEARKYFKKGIAIYPNFSEAFYYLGATHKELNELDSACQNLQKAKELRLKGYYSEDIYVELFHEVYLSEINRSLKNTCH